MRLIWFRLYYQAIILSVAFYIKGRRPLVQECHGCLFLFHSWG
uniref:Uncharacterized protein n=1 Tax=Anguilla anguilla TaxID=7936 RepID=A0A0E9QW35_ANGAN